METKYKHYTSLFTDVNGKAWGLVISYPDTEETKGYPDNKMVRLGMPPVTLTTESEDAISPIVKGRLSFSLLEERATERYRHLAQAPEGAVSVYLTEVQGGIPEGDVVVHLHEHLYPYQAIGNAFWVGTLDPESYKEPANQDTGYLVSFEASDFGYMSRVPLTKEWAYDDRCDLKPRENLFMLVQKLLKRGLSGWVAQRYKEYRVNSYKLMASNVAHCYTRYTGTLYMGAEQTPTDFNERMLLFDTSQFFIDKEKPISVLEALERVLSALGLRIEQAAGTFFITDMQALDGGGTDKVRRPNINNPIGQASLEASPMEVKGDDGELSLHSSYSSLVVNTRTYLDALSWEMELPKMDSFVPWKRVLRTLSNGDKVGAWSYRTTDIVGEYKQAALLETKAESTGEDNDFYALVWNPKSIHGRLSLQMPGGITSGEYNVFRIKGDDWKHISSGAFKNLGMRVYNDAGTPMDLGMFYGYEFNYSQTRSFDQESMLGDAVMADKYVKMLQWYIDMLKRGGGGEELKHVKPWEFSIPNHSEEGDFYLRLDAPLYLSFNSDIYQEFSVDSAVFLEAVGRNIYSNGAHSTTHSRIQDEAQRKKVEKSIEFIRTFTDKLTGARVDFSMKASNEAAGEELYLKGDLSGFEWSKDEHNSVCTLTYGGDGKLRWNGFNHAKSSKDEGEGMKIPMPPKGFTKIEVELYSDPAFYSGNDKFTDWKLWNVPSAILIQAPKIWMSDRQGRKVSEISKERSERFTFSDATRESQDLDIHYSSGYRIPAVSPSIIYYPDGAMPDTIGKDRSYPTDYMLSAYMAQRFGRVYGSLPSRGYELSGTFAWEVFPKNRQYMDMEWIPVSREIDIQQRTERGTYHQIRPYSSVTEHMLTPEVLEGERPLNYFGGGGLPIPRPSIEDYPSYSVPPRRR